MSNNDDRETLPRTRPVITGEQAGGEQSTANSLEGEVQVGDVVSERYELVKLLGEGGMGRVFLATDQLYAREFEDRQSQVAIKFLGLQFSAHSVARMALQREARKSQQLSHPNVVRVLHFDQYKGMPYMIMEFMKGQPMDGFLREHCREGLPLKRALPLIEGMANGLEYIHEQGLIHSDFKPNNVFVGEDGTAKILDLGIARAREDTFEDLEKTRFNASELGAMTPAYASCEMFQGQAPDPRDDVYALACVTYELLAGRHPFNRQPAVRARTEGAKPERPKGLSAARWRVLKSGLAFERTERLGSARVLATGLLGSNRSRERWGALAALALVVLGAIVWVGNTAPKGPDPVELFLDSLTPPRTAALSPRDADRVASWQEQGEAYLDVAGELYSQGDLAEALHVMNGGADNAYRAFTNVLRMQRSEPARQQVMKMLGIYATWAERSASEGDLETALLITCRGLKIHPGNPVLQQQEASYRGQLPAERPANLNDC